MKTLERPKFEGEKKPEKKETEARYHFEEIAELEKPMANLVEQLKESIDKGEYDTLISDDASGRIPTLILREVLKARIKELNLKTFFIAGGFSLQESEQKKLWHDFFKQINTQVKKKALLVTEYIGSGGAVRRLTDSMADAGIIFDVASATMRTVSDDPFFAEQQQENLKEIKNNHKLFFGERTLRVPSIWVRKDLSGVAKYSQQETAYPELARYASAETKKEAREDVKLMAKRILEKVWGKS